MIWGCASAVQIFYDLTWRASGNSDSRTWSGNGPGTAAVERHFLMQPCCEMDPADGVVRQKWIDAQMGHP